MDSLNKGKIIFKIDYEILTVKKGKPTSLTSSITIACYRQDQCSQYAVNYTFDVTSV